MLRYQTSTLGSKLQIRMKFNYFRRFGGTKHRKTSTRLLSHRRSGVEDRPDDQDLVENHKEKEDDLQFTPPRCTRIRYHKSCDQYARDWLSPQDKNRSKDNLPPDDILEIYLTDQRKPFRRHTSYYRRMGNGDSPRPGVRSGKKRNVGVRRDALLDRGEGVALNEDTVSSLTVPSLQRLATVVSPRDEESFSRNVVGEEGAVGETRQPSSGSENSPRAGGENVGTEFKKEEEEGGTKGGGEPGDGPDSDKIRYTRSPRLRNSRLYVRTAPRHRLVPGVCNGALDSGKDQGEILSDRNVSSGPALAPRPHRVAYYPLVAVPAAEGGETPWKSPHRPPSRPGTDHSQSSRLYSGAHRIVSSPSTKSRPVRNISSTVIDRNPAKGNHVTDVFLDTFVRPSKSKSVDERNGPGPGPGDKVPADVLVAEAVSDYLDYFVFNRGRSKTQSFTLSSSARPPGASSALVLNISTNSCMWCVR